MRNIVVQEKVYTLDNITNSNSSTQNVFFRQDSQWLHGKTDGIVSIILYPLEVSGTIGTITMGIKPLDEAGNTFANSDYDQTLMSAVSVSSKVKGTDGGYGYEITGLPKCWGFELTVTHAGTAVVTPIVSVLF